ncbi:unnamed protein product [Orchesella dallaii]|uniref:Uncharacterized protein n=1 Tax=Orchesella dallaii TaxID=48710 RepID=A0ABP1S3G8_9HEXA
MDNGGCWWCLPPPPPVLTYTRRIPGSPPQPVVRQVTATGVVDLGQATLTTTSKTIIFNVPMDNTQSTQLTTLPAARSATRYTLKSMPMPMQSSTKEGVGMTWNFYFYWSG